MDYAVILLVPWLAWIAVSLSTIADAMAGDDD